MPRLTVTRSRYERKCYRCGQIVPKGEGMLEIYTLDEYRKWWPHVRPQTYFNKWFISHPTCYVKYKDTDIHYKYNPIKDISEK